jgi:hypothetical protein
MNYESPYTIWWDKHIQGKYGLSATVRELMAMAFEGGRQSRDAEIEALKAQLEKSVADGIHKNLMSLYDRKASEK